MRLKTLPQKKQQDLKKLINKEVFVPLLKDHKDLSLQLAVIYKQQVGQWSFGPKYKFFDLASLTKPIFTMSLFFFLEQEQKGILQKQVQSFLPWFKHKNVKVKDLLAHQSGAPALYPVFKKLQSSTTQIGLTPLNLLLRDIEFSETESVYSDVGYFILGAIIEEIFNLSLYEVFLKFKNAELKTSLAEWGNMHFRFTGELHNKKDYAPTEKCPLRGKMIQGEVHDESCWKMGGVGPHAGLFGELKDVVNWVKTLNQVFGQNKFYKNSVIEAFYKKQKGDWRLGTMSPSQPRSTAGRYFSPQSYGHLGFTGTSFWVDPTKELSVIVLSNRTFPDRRINVLGQFRPYIHDVIHQYFFKEN